MSKNNSTKVALVCLKTSQHITNHLLITVFSKHGKINKILIFEQGPLQTKVFIEYEEIEQAVDAINQLNNTKILNNILCNVYPSRLNELKLDNVPFTKGIDLTKKSPFKLPSLWDLNISDDDTIQQQVSEDKLIDIRNKLSLIDDEITQTIENKLDYALIKLQQHTKCLGVFIGDTNINDILYKIKPYKIVCLKQLHCELYVKFDSEKECLKAYEELKNKMIVQLKFGFDSLPGNVMDLQ